MFKKKPPKDTPAAQATACGSTLAAILVSMRAITPSQLDAARAEFHESAQADMMLLHTYLEPCIACYKKKKKVELFECADILNEGVLYF